MSSGTETETGFSAHFPWEGHWGALVQAQCMKSWPPPFLLGTDYEGCMAFHEAWWGKNLISKDLPICRCWGQGHTQRF